jgi:3'-5' exoribonuclease
MIQPNLTDRVIDLRQIQAGHHLHHTLLVQAVDQRMSGDQRFAVLTLGNCTGRIVTAPFWAEELPRLDGITRGRVVQVIGEIALYRDQQQLRVTSIRLLPNENIAWDDLLPSAGDTSPYWKLVDNWRGEIAGKRLRDTLALFYEDPHFRHVYDRCPASVSGHHAELGGLLRHTCEVANIARAVSQTCQADGDLVVAGVLLHDIGKLESYSWQGGFAYTDRGSLYGHVVLGSLMLARRVREASPMPCTEHELDILQHLVLSHHGRLEFGAPVPPMTLEAEILHYSDNASARTASMAEALTLDDNFTGTELVSAKSLWQLDRRRIYRGSSDWGREPARAASDPQWNSTPLKTI